MLFDCIISQLIVKGLSKTHQDFISINEFFSKITPSLFNGKEGRGDFRKYPSLWQKKDGVGFRKNPYGKGRKTEVVSDSSLQRAVAA